MFQDINKELRESKAKVQGYIDEKDTMMGEHTSLQKNKAKLELDLKDVQEELAGESHDRVRKKRGKLNGKNNVRNNHASPHKIDKT